MICIRAVRLIYFNTGLCVLHSGDGIGQVCGIDSFHQTGIEGLSNSRVNGQAGQHGEAKLLSNLVNMGLAEELRSKGIRVELELEERSFKAQMRSANRSKAKLTVIRGDNELEAGIAAVKRMDDGSQIEMKSEDLATYIAANI